MPRIGGSGGGDFEKVPVDEWLLGVIEEIEYNPEREVKAFGSDEKIKQAQVRLKFKLDGYEFMHPSSWMKASTHKKSKFHNKYLKYLCPEVDTEGQEIELSCLQGLRVKVMYENSGEWQNVSQVRAIDTKCNPLVSDLGIHAV